MDIFAIAFLILILIGVKPVRCNEDYIGRDTTTTIKGIFAIIILFNHSRQYLSTPLTNWGGHSYAILYNSIIDIFGQLMVVMFLVYSGFGIMESFKRKKNDYIKGFVRKRVLKTLVHFDIAVFLFLLVALAFGHEYTPRNYALSWIGWESIGNSNWFIFDIIILYLLSYFGLALVARYNLNEKHFLWIIFVMSSAFLLFMFKSKPGMVWWYDTILAFPAGMLWSAYKPQLEQKLRNQQIYITSLLITTAVMVITCYLGRNFMEAFLYICSPVFAIFVILVTMRLRLGNRVLNWLGINAFAIYILQRIPMIIAAEYGLHLNPVLFFSVVMPSTLIIASLFTSTMTKLDKRLFA